MQTFSYHTHTNFSDGKSSIQEMLSQALKAGFTEIGISDHFIVHKNIKNSACWEMLQSYSDKIYQEDFGAACKMISQNIKMIRDVAADFPLKVSVGLEADFFIYDGWLKEFKDALNSLDLDYVISGNHFLFDETGLDIVDITSAKSYISDLETQRVYGKRHFATLAQAAESGLFEFIAHLDYFRRSNIRFQDDFRDDKMKVIEALADSKTATEISTKGLRRIGDFYPARWLLEELKKHNVQIVISDDAHHTSELGKDFDKAEECLKELNYQNRWTFSEKSIAI